MRNFKLEEDTDADIETAAPADDAMNFIYQKQGSGLGGEQDLICGEHDIDCPHCGEPQTIEIELDGEADFVEDCGVCCRPILVTAGAEGVVVDKA